MSMLIRPNRLAYSLHALKFFVNSLDAELAKQIVEPDLDPHFLHSIMAFLFFFRKDNLKKKISRHKMCNKVN